MLCGEHHTIAAQGTSSFLLTVYRRWVDGRMEKLKQDLPGKEDRIRYCLRFERMIRSKMEWDRAELDDSLESD